MTPRERIAWLRDELELWWLGKCESVSHWWNPPPPPLPPVVEPEPPPKPFPPPGLVEELVQVVTDQGIAYLGYMDVVPGHFPAIQIRLHGHQTLRWVVGQYGPDYEDTLEGIVSLKTPQLLVVEFDPRMGHPVYCLKYVAYDVPRLPKITLLAQSVLMIIPATDHQKMMMFEARKIEANALPEVVNAS